MRRIGFFLFALGSAALMGACGYTFQHSNNPLLTRYGVRKVHVAPIQNATFKAGVENVVYNEALKVIAAHRRVILVQNRADADAILQGVVSEATYVKSATTTADQLFPTARLLGTIKRPSANLQVATEYSARLSTQFSLRLTRPRLGEKEEIWAGSFAKAQAFPANNQLSVYGTTGHLINESEFDRTLKDLAESLVYNLHESMLALF